MRGPAFRKTIHWIDWGTVSLPKSLGGLGIADLGIKNRALLTKWVWRYVREDGSLWLSVIDSVEGLVSRSLLPPSPNGRRGSLVWRNIISSSPLTTFPNFSDCDFGFILGNGRKICFWQDCWAENLVLRYEFPRIFALVRNKVGVVADFGVWNGLVWEWRIDLRRNVFDWERGQWSNFLKVLNLQFPHPTREDQLIWKPNPRGVYTAQSFYRRNRSLPVYVSPVWKLIWVNLAPLKLRFSHGSSSGIASLLRTTSVVGDCWTRRLLFVLSARRNSKLLLTFFLLPVCIVDMGCLLFTMGCTRLLSR